MVPDQLFPSVFNVLTAIPLEFIPTEFTWNGTAANKTVQKVVLFIPFKLLLFMIWWF